MVNDSVVKFDYEYIMKPYDRQQVLCRTPFNKFNPKVYTFGLPDKTV